MSSFAEAYERIKFATNTKTQIGLAEVLDIRQSSISDAKRRQSIPADWYIKLFEKFGLSPDWLKQGAGPMYLRTEQGYQPQDAPVGGIAEEPAHYGDSMAKNAIVTVYKMSGEGGTAEMHNLQVHSKLSLPLGFSGAEITVLCMESPNIAPYIERGAFVGIDTSITTPISGVLFAIYKPHEGVVINRVYYDGDNQRYILRSDASGYPESTMTPEKLTKSVMGKVCWVLQKI